MRVFDLMEAKKRFFELFRDVENGETIGIRLRGEIAALIQPPHQACELQRAFHDLVPVRGNVRKKKGIANRKLSRKRRRY